LRKILSGTGVIQALSGGSVCKIIVKKYGTATHETRMTSGIVGQRRRAVKYGRERPGFNGGMTKNIAPPQRLILRVPSEAAAALGVSDEFFDQHCRPELRLIRRGRYTFVAVSELQRWADANGARTLRGERA
jgi:hypothetical protein